MARLQTRNSSFSLRAFAKRLGMNPAIISEVLNGKRNLSPSMMKKILDRLDIAPVEHDQWIQAASEFERIERKQLSMDQFQLISEGIHFAILSLLETEDASFTTEWIATRLGFSQAKVEKAIERLLEFEMIEKLEKNQYRCTGVQFTSTDGISSLGIRKSHRETLEWAQESLDEDSVEERDFMAMTMAIDPSLLPEVKLIIREALDKISKLADSKSKTEVYKVAMQVFPISVPALNNKKEKL